MALEQSHGKRRPTLPRSRALAPVATARDRAAGRDADGRFLPGNRVSVRQGEKHAMRKLLGDAAAEGDASLVSRDALRLLNGAIRDLPSDGPVVRSIAALYARHAAAAGFYNAKADAKGLDSAEGIALADIALRHGQRAERLAVTMLDVSSTLARDASPAIDLDAARRRLESPPVEASESEPPEPEYPAAGAPAHPKPGFRVGPPEADDDSWIDAPPVEATEPRREEPAAASRELTTEDVLQRAFNRRPAQPPAAAGPCSHGVPGGTPASCAACARIEQHVNGRRSDGMCPHGLNPQTCLECFKARQAAAERPGGIPWREGLPRSHPQYRGPR
jgi:hypothetical protein